MMAEPGSARERKVQGVCHRQGRAIVRQAFASCEPILTKSLQCCLGFNCVTQTCRFPVVLPHQALGQTLAENFSILFVCSL